MNKYLFSFLILITNSFSKIAHSQTGFEKVYGGANPEKFQSVIATSDGGILTCGDTKSFGLGDLGNTDGYVVKMNASGDTLWTRTFGSIYNDEANQVMENSKGYLVAGHNVSPNPLTYDFYLAQYDFSGNQLWEKFYIAAGTDYCYDALIDSKKQIILAGGTNSFTFGGSDFYIVVADSNGNFINQYHYGGVGNEIANSIIQTSDGGFALVGYTNTGTPGYNINVVKTDSNFVQQWAQNFGGINDDIGWDIQEDVNQNLWILGYQETQPDSSRIVLIKTNSAGSNAAKYFPSSNAGDYGFQLLKNASGGFSITGYTNVIGKGSEMLLQRINSNGDTLWSRHYGGTKAESGFASATTANGDFIIAGTTDGFGIVNNDAYLVKTDSSGNVPCAANVSFIASDDAACNNESVQFTNTTVSSQNFTWKIDGNDFSNEVDAAYYFDVAGDYNISLSNCNSSLSKNILVNEKPATHFTYSAVNNSVQFILDPGISVQSISWNFGDASPINIVDMNPLHNYPFPGMYWVILQVTDNAGCDSTYIEQINVLTGIYEISAASFEVYPNPVSDEFSLKGNLDFPVEVQIVNSLGRIIASNNLINSKSRIDIKNLPAGVYSILGTDYLGKRFCKIFSKN